MIIKLNKMRNLPKIALILALIISVVTIYAQTTFAFGDCDKGLRSWKGDKYGLVPKEIKEQFKVEFENLSDEEKAELKEQYRAMKQEMKQNKIAAMEEFTGLTHEEIKAAHLEGKTMGEILAEQGITEEQAEEFLTEQTNEKVDQIVEKHDLDEEQEQTLRDRIVEFVQRILEKWFGIK